MQGYALLFSPEALKFRYQQQIAQQRRLREKHLHEAIGHYEDRMGLPPANTLSGLEEAKIAEVLDLLFEPSPALHSLLIPQIKSSSVSSYTDLASLAKQTLNSLSSDSPILLSILSAHPRLGAKKVDSAQSQSEQKSLGNENERKQLQKLNEEYEEKFPGLRYVVFVNGRSREVIMTDMKNRIETGTRDGECVKASEAMCDIAVDRARNLGAE